jgi:predicted pyridoxine 5'-phosphate oxidase superfamily flavin-nucleotide-binding protein
MANVPTRSNGASPFHEGEREVQARVGVRERIEHTGRRLLRDFMPDEHREFFEDLPFLVAASESHDGAVWASLLVGEPGFVRSPDPRRLRVAHRPLPADPLTDSLRPGAPLGLLGIELATRRRNRANGRVRRVDAQSFELDVEQSFGNCKQYIQARAGTFAAPSSLALPDREAALLSPAATELLRRADTTFIATASRQPDLGGSEGLDASHRGGLPGFIRVGSDRGETVLTLPDFSGNFLFNSFGNLEVNPRAGLLALDFARGFVLSLSGSARVIWEGPELRAFEKAQRLLEFRPKLGLLWSDVLLGWSEPEMSPHLVPMGRKDP